jgi:uncharacterized protein YcbX
LGHRAILAHDGEPLVDGRRWSTAEVARDVEEAAGPGCHLVRDTTARRFDVLPLLVATDGAIAALGEDRRRLRPNILIGGVAGLAEREWEGRSLRIGSTVIHAVNLRARCIMTTFDPDTLAQDTGVLRRIHREFDGVMALNCSVVEPGEINAGDAVTLLD